MSNNIRTQSHRKKLENNLFEQLGTTSRKTGTVPIKILEEQARQLHLGDAVTHGTASFYDFLNEESKGKTRWACQGTSCLVSGKVANSPPNSSKEGHSLCVGYCYQGHGVLQKDAQGCFHSHSHQQDKQPKQPDMPVYTLAKTAILTAKDENIIDLYSTVFKQQTDILSELEQSNLRGRGGAGFPFAFKLEACAGQKADEKYIVCNADEGDPGAFSDRYLLEQQPHKVLAGMYAAALHTGAADCVLYIRREYPESIETIRTAIDEYNAFDHVISSKVRFHIIEGAGSYVCGEETALLNSIEGLRPEVRTRPPFPAQYGLWGQPTVLSNVETFANIPWIIAHGGAAYAAIGIGKSTGTKLISLDNGFVKSGLYEVDFGLSFNDLIFNHADGFIAATKAVQVGGPLGSVIPIDHTKDMIISFEDFQQQGFALGHAGIIAIPQRFAMIDLLHHLFSYMADESCGKCTPCRIGTAKGADMLQLAINGKPINQTIFDELLDLLETTSLCALGGGLPLPVHNILQHFSGELKTYFHAQGE